MSILGKSAKVGLYIFGFLILLVIGVAAYIYINMDSIAKQVTEKIASDALGVPVHIGGMDISLEEKKVIVSDIRIANPSGYKKPNAIRVETIEIAGESFSKELLVFSRIMVDGTNVNLEVSDKGTNLSDIKNNIAIKSKKSGGAAADSSGGSNIKVIVKKFSLTKAQLNPSVTLIGGDLAYVDIPDIHLKAIGQKEKGVLAEQAIAQIMQELLNRFNKSANSAGFLKGMSLDVLNAMGVSTVEVFKKNLKDSYNKDVEGLKQGLDGLKKLFK